ncbi:MAG: hypothetical protein QOF17_572 [Solirubrobacteraceae bacterium]|jgi:hypothetical protein|nr:hypothetical protein [Solirubrobacteraceae bacterium]
MSESWLLYSATPSLDGFIAGAGGDMSWLGERLSSEVDVGELMAGIGALLIGKRTFTGDDPNKGTDSEGAFGGSGTARRSSWWRRKRSAGAGPGSDRVVTQRRATRRQRWATPAVEPTVAAA